MCTHFQLQSADRNQVVGRSMEFARPLDPAFYIQRRGETFQQPVWAGAEFQKMETAAGWSVRYGYVGVSSTNLPLPGISQRIVTDGLNEAGLSVSLLWLPQTRYQEFSSLQTTVLAPLFADWVLAHCGSVADVRELLPTRQFWLPDWLAKQLPLHAAIVDKDGRSLVVEFQDGQQKIYHNPVGVCTNAPWFPWHLDNLGNYLNLTPNDPAPQEIGTLSVAAPGHGGGLAGLPGNATPPARFVRTVYLKQYADTPADLPQAYTLATHLLNAVDIPRGVIRDGAEQDYTQWAVVKGLNSGEIGLRTYDSMQYCGLKLAEIDFGSVDTQVIPLPKLADISFIQPR
ncbi:linear amide C-N hydrolase [Chromobacterium sp. ATCC 53434]|uniref:linear amide C-N hydrolase n=1 Tax=Chromobacterium TaxID=535 RepID=UPI000C76E588|nr:linear amide C-N hydrolase [Chromobacterium sp. ATCC 53434]AUH52200.1 linear amide C-N hydrolase [Chromobacterium sp. ATCC 53434]